MCMPGAKYCAKCLWTNEHVIHYLQRVSTTSSACCLKCIFIQCMHSVHSFFACLCILTLYDQYCMHGGVTQHLGCRLLWIGPGCQFLAHCYFTLSWWDRLLWWWRSGWSCPLSCWLFLVWHFYIYSKEEARDGLSELRSMYLVAHFPQKQDIYQFKWQAMKFVERGGTTRRNRPQCACFENHSASSHLPYNLPPLVNLGDSTQSWRVQDAHSVSILGPVFANCGFSATCAPHYSGVGGSHQPSWLLSVLPSLNDDDGDVKRSFRKVRSPT